MRLPTLFAGQPRIRALHDAALEPASVPLPVLNARIDRFIAEDDKGPYPNEE
jgi:uncharacterized protein (DUF885 family)